MKGLAWAWWFQRVRSCLDPWLWVCGERGHPGGRTCWVRANPFMAARKGDGQALILQNKCGGAVLPPTTSSSSRPHSLHRAPSPHHCVPKPQHQLCLRFPSPSTLLPAPSQPCQTEPYGAGVNEVLIMCHSESGSGTARCPAFRVQTGWNWLPCHWLAY